jgi:hypothetical protein
LQENIQINANSSQSKYFKGHEKEELQLRNDVQHSNGREMRKDEQVRGDGEEFNCLQL